MGQQVILTIPAVEANSKQGTPLAEAFKMINENFTELYQDDTNDVNSVNAGTGISVDQTTGAVTVTNTAPNATHTGDVTGSETLTLADDVVTYAKLGVEFKNVNALGNISIIESLDFGSYQVFTATLTAATDITYNNAKVGTVKDLIINADGNSFTLPTGTKIIAGTPTTGINFIQVVVTAAGEYWTSISQEQV
jgi:sporulation protein YlmC with PRC-barrel domain